MIDRMNSAGGTWWLLVFAFYPANDVINAEPIFSWDDDTNAPPPV